MFERFGRIRHCDPHGDRVEALSKCISYEWRGRENSAHMRGRRAEGLASDALLDGIEAIERLNSVTFLNLICAYFFRKKFIFEKKKFLRRKKGTCFVCDAILCYATPSPFCDAQFIFCDAIIMFGYINVIKSHLGTLYDLTISSH